MSLLEFLAIMTDYSIGEVELTYKNKVAYNRRKKIASSKDANDQFREFANPDTMDYKEHFYVLFLNQSGHLTGYQTQASGGISSCQPDIRQILQGALLTNSSGIIIAHNHPSGNTSPSIEDRNFTKQMGDACRIMNLRLLDHIILTSERYYSFSDEGEL